MMLVSYLTSLLGFCFLLILFVVDIRKHLLPNIWVAALAVTGLLHHGLQEWSSLSLIDSLLGCLLAGFFLLLVRAFFNKRHKKETLGLGDVKLMMAGGLWLGPEAILFAISLGAFIGVLIGLFLINLYRYKTKTSVSLFSTEFPAGPGFIIGLIVMFYVSFLF